MTGWKGNIAALVLLALLASGCAREPFPSADEPGIVLTVRCDNPALTKAESKDGEQSYNENVIKSVDFLFYPGENPGENTPALHHIRKELSENTMQPGLWEASFNLVIKKDIIGSLFTDGNGLKATVYALVNFERDFVGELSGTSRAALGARRIVTDFAAEETGYIQPSFLMDGSTVITYNPDTNPNSTGEIPLKRFASKFTVALSVAPEVELIHRNSDKEANEIWTPVLSTMRVYLVDGVKSTLLGGNDTSPEFFSYGADANRRAYVKDNGTPYLNTETQGETLYYNTWPMYSYPVNWTAEVGSIPDYENMNYIGGLPAEPPYFKLEMDWRREARNGYQYDRRKYYYKILMPADEIRRNNWYGLYLDVSILGSETDEGKAVIEPTCYLLDWQNKSYAINKYATISKARYLSLDNSEWEINNMETLSIPFLSSHNVVVVPGSVEATRPYYGSVSGKLPVYNTTYHAWINKAADGTYYLDYKGQTSGNEKYEPSEWLTNTSTSIELRHELKNEYTNKDFDYSPYTIEFDVVHEDLVEDPDSHTYKQYLRHIKIVQNPGIYVKALRNRDTKVAARSGDKEIPYGYTDGSWPWLDKPWGYVFVNGGRFIRRDKKSASTSDDPFYTLTNNNAKSEYQWQTVWYTGGSRDMYDIHVTVLPSTSSFVIGDPREDNVNNLDSKADYPNLYEYTVEGKNSDEVWNNLSLLETIRSGSTEYPEVEPGVYRRTGFNSAKALYGDEPTRPLRWYYPTDKTDRTVNMLAPSYRIASKFGGTEYGDGFYKQITKAYAEYRCAAYQEDGFPAGRWRLPTKAEIHFIAQLSANSVFSEPLFSNVTYWSATGAVQVSSGSVKDSSSGVALLRCVYDSWYWDKVDGKEDDPRQDDPWTFVWGDRER